MFCEKCGSKLKEGTRFCIHCGAPINEGNNVPPVVQNQPDKMIVNAPIKATSEAAKKSDGAGKNIIYIILIIICLFILIGILVAGYFLFEKDNQKSNNINSKYRDTQTQEMAVGESTGNTSKEIVAEEADVDAEETVAESTDVDTEETVEESTDVTTNKTVTETATATEDLVNQTTDTKDKEHSYEFYIEDITWAEASKKCSQMGGHLCTITSQEELDIVEDYLKYLNVDDESIMQIWLGGFCVSGQYIWETGEPFTYSNWLEGEPSYYDSSAGVSEEFICCYYKDDLDTWVWNDVPNDISQWWKGRIAYICEWDN